MPGFIGRPPAAEGQPACGRCGAAAEDGQALCTVCQLNEDTRAFGTDPPVNLEEIKRRHLLPADARASIIHVPGETFDVSQWRRCRVQMFALPLEPDVSAGTPGSPWTYDPLPKTDRPGIVARWRLRHPGLSGVLEMAWDYWERKPDWRTRRLPPEAKEDRDRLIALLCREPTVRRPGPAPGTGAKFKTQAEWHRALRASVLPRKTVATADDTTIALWLDISPALLYRLMKRWGPEHLDDIRQGRF